MGGCFGLSVIKGSTSMYGAHFLLLVMILLLLFYFVSFDSLLLNAQLEFNNNNKSDATSKNNNILKNSTNDGILDVLLELIPYPAKVDFESMKFKLTFLKPNTTQLQDHVDFNLRIFNNGERVFQATNQTGQPFVPLHATNGYMTIPILNYQFEQAGQYQIEIPIYGVLFNPIRPESANFTIEVGS